MKSISDEFLEEKMGAVTESLRKRGSVIVAFSGGVDSSVVVALAHRAVGHNSLAVTMDSPLLPSRELKDARTIAKQIGVKHLVVKLNQLEILGFRNNPPHRCYLCKKAWFQKLKEMAVKKGFKAIADGTNLSDMDEYRPGLKAKEELGVYSPLLEAGLSKEDTCRMAKLLELPMAGKPASPCLASRVPYGHELTEAKLVRIDHAENCIRVLTGVKVLRVRDHDDLARIEVGQDEHGLFFRDDTLHRIARNLKELGYDFVTFDLEGYRSGSFDKNLSNTLMSL